MSGFTLLELLFCCVLLAILGGIGATYLRPENAPKTAEMCLAEVEGFLATARARSMLAQTDSRVTFNMSGNSISGNWSEPPLLLGKKCTLRAAAFGVAGKRAAEALFYPSGAVSPGELLVVGTRGDLCRLKLGIRGGRSRSCS